MSLSDLPELRRLWPFNGGVHPRQNKHPSTRNNIEQALIPDRLTLPLHQHIGEPAEPLVSIGDQVLKGQQIARANGYVSSPIHAPTSGTVVDIANYDIPHPSGLSAQSIVIATDGKDQWQERQPIGDDFLDLDASELRNLIREAGIVGLGGAGFPSFIKLNPGHDKVVKTLIVNGVECEPYITCDDMLMRERPDDIIQGLVITQHALQAQECLIAIEDNKPHAIASMRQAVAEIDNMHVVPVPTLYPQGSEKQLIKVLTGQEVPSDGLSLHIGVVGINVGTAAAIYRAVYRGEPLISRIATITGSAVGKPRNLEILFGTPIRKLIEQCDGNPNDVGELIMGGPMMGFAMQQDSLPVIKTTNCILALSKESLPPEQPIMPCIRCGACMDACPINLMPQQLYWYTRSKDFEKTQEFNLFDCIECGCCSYVCPSNIPLVQHYRYAKGEIWTSEREKEKADVARRRHEFRQLRLDREKAEKEARRKKKKAALMNKGQGSASAQAKDAKRAEIQAAMERAKQRRESAQNQAANWKPTDADKGIDSSSGSDSKSDSNPASKPNKPTQPS